MTDRELKTACHWMVGPNVGISSTTIWAVMMGVKPDDPYVPLDPDDFGRCWKLLVLMPAWRERLPEVAKKYPAWGPLIREWDKLTAMYEEVLKGKDGWDRDASKRMYDFMAPLIAEGRDSKR